MVTANLQTAIRLASSVATSSTAQVSLETTAALYAAVVITSAATASLQTFTLPATTGTGALMLVPTQGGAMTVDPEDAAMAVA